MPDLLRGIDVNFCNYFLNRMRFIEGGFDRGFPPESMRNVGIDQRLGGCYGGTMRGKNKASGVIFHSLK